MKKTEIFDNRIETTAQLINRLARRAAGLPDAQKALFAEALEELQTSLEELQVSGEELSQQAEELSEARLAAEEERQRYLGLFAFAPDAYLVTDSEGIIAEANERAGTLLRVRPAALVRKPLAVFVDKNDRKAFYAQMGRLAETARREDWEIYLRPRAGQPFPARVDATAIPARSGGITGFRWLIRDATEAKKRELEARLATFPELNPEPIVEADESGHVYYINSSGRRLLRGFPEEGAGHPWLEGIGEAAAKLHKSRKSSATREVQVNGRWFLQTIWLAQDDNRVRIYGKEITERKRAEGSLREARDYLDSLFNYANAPIVVWDPRSTVTRFNRAFEDLTGLKADEVIGRDIGILFPKDRRPESLGLIRRTIAEGERWEAVEIPILHRDGSVRTVLWNSANILGPDGKTVVATIAQGQDITERKQIEEALLVNQTELEDRVAERTEELARSSELLERVFASVDLAIAYMDKGFRFIRVNKAFADAFGRNPEDYRGQGLFALYPDSEAEAVFRRVLETGAPHVALESPFLSDRMPGPGPRYWDWSLQRVAAGEGPEGLVLSLVDVTPRIKAEEERRRLATAVQQSSEGIVITDPSDRILYVNRAFQDMHGLAQREILGRQYGEILQLDEEDAGFRRGIRESLDRGAVWKGRLTRTIGGRPERKLDVTISPVRDPSGEIVNFAVLEHDVTHEHRLEASVRQLQKLDALGSLAGGIAHDFNNILVPIFINAELAAFDAEKDSPLAGYLQLILEAANRGRELVKQIISFSRPSEQKRGLVDLVAVVREAAQFLKSSIPRSIVIQERLDLPSGIVRADPTQLHQVLMNLGNNAAHAMREKGGRLDLAVSGLVVDTAMASQNPELRPGPYVKLTVADTGVGMTPEVREKIFDPFFTTKRRGEGSGMGLTVAHGIVKGHGGAITVSTAPGLGTTFEVYLPAASGDAKPARPEAIPAPLGKGRVLFIDDEDMLVRTVPAMLTRLGFTVTSLTDPGEALSLFRRDPRQFDLVITDETMPGLTGEKLAREMLRLRPDLPIILSTGFSEVVHEEQARAMGIRAFVMKPFSTAEIAEKIQEALKKA